jgi:isocitrate dehydrogenase
MYWAEALANQTEDSNLSSKFSDLYNSLSDNEEKINTELIDVQGNPVDIQGYYNPNDELASTAMRPSETLNGILLSF